MGANTGGSFIVILAGFEDIIYDFVQYHSWEYLFFRWQ